MAEEPQQADERDGERDETADESAGDLTVRPEEADEVKGGVVGPCGRPAR